MSMSRFILPFVLVMGAVLGLPGMGLSQDKALSQDKGLSQAPPPASRPFIIGFPQDDMSNDWRAAQVRAVERALKAYPNVRFIFTDAEGDTARNVLDIEMMAAEGIDLMIVSPRSQGAMAPLIARLYRDGLPIVLLTRKITGEEFTTFIAPDDERIAAEAARELAHRLNGEGAILVLQGVPTASTAIKRLNGFEQALKEFPGLRIAQVIPANYKRQDAITAVEYAIESGLKFDAIYAQSDSMAEGARIALEALKRDPGGIPIVGIDYIASAREAIRNGQQSASFTYPTCGTEGAEAAMKILNGQSVPKYQTVPSVKVTRDNVDQIDTIF